MCLSTLADVQPVRCSLSHLICWVSELCWSTVRFLIGVQVKRQDVFGGVGQPSSLIDRIVGFSEAPSSYQAFDKGEIGKVIFDPWQ